MAPAKASKQNRIQSKRPKPANGNGNGNGNGARKIVLWDKSGASGKRHHVKPCFQDQAHAPARKTLSHLKLPSYCMGDLSAVDVKEYLKYSDTVLIPKASMEQHGPHLPLFCDSIHATQVARRAGQKAGILYTPTLFLGYSP